MGRCGCGSAGCTCAVSGGDGIKVTGNGGATSPYIVEVDLGTGTGGGCSEVMDCVGSNAGPGLTYSNNTLAVDLSSDTGNLLEFGSDDGLYGPTTKLQAGSAVTIQGNGTPEAPYVINAGSEIGDTAIVAGDGVNIDGSGVASDPYVVSAQRYYAYGSMQQKPIDVQSTDVWVTPVIDGANDPGFRLGVNSSGVTRVRLPVAGVWFMEANFKFNSNGGFAVRTDGQSGAMFYYAISANGRGMNVAFPVSRASSILGVNYTVTDDFGTSAGSVGFRVRKSGGFVGTPSLVSGTWSAHYLGPTVSGVSRTLEEALEMERRNDPAIGEY